MFSKWMNFLWHLTLGNLAWFVLLLDHLAPIISCVLYIYEICIVWPCVYVNYTVYWTQNMQCQHLHVHIVEVLMPAPAKQLANWIMFLHYSAVIIGTMASQITSLTAVYTTDYSGADQRKYQSSASLAFVWGIHRWPVNSPHKWPVTRKMFQFDDVIIGLTLHTEYYKTQSIVSGTSAVASQCYRHIMPHS